ncbi:uncharacterized protein LOC107371289 [Tetranychus urticae]|uniref:uncharacterized protein LOC107371289 n=1 Tax=Tetranychus urticae TaxID=32264 RepID=UPI00077BBBF0|nr:uncharacterized protein LOC107371289 [Tetranychus urticae]
MLLRLLIVFTFYSSISTLSTNSLVDLPLKVPEGSSVINATLTDVSGSKKYFIQELISTSGSAIKGKILVSSDKDSYSIHYNADSYTGVDSKERLVIQGTNCLLFTYKNIWDKTLSGIIKPLLNEILLMGPSILYRIDRSLFNWKSIGEKNIRGIMMRGASAKVNENLKITFYYKSRLDFQSGMESPSRIEFGGYDSTTIPNPGKDSIFYVDIYFIEHVDTYFEEEDLFLDQVQNEVQPPSGIGCPHYLSGDKALPALRVYHMHYIMEERIKGSTTSRSLSEVYAAQFYEFLRIKTSLVGSPSEVMYDYRLGVAFHVDTDGSVAVVSIDTNTPGIYKDSKFTLTSLFMVNAIYRYLGKLNLKHRSGLPVEAWESVEYNVNINGKKVDKAVITQYFAPSQDEDIFWGYSLVSTKISIYDYDVSKKVYDWKDEITRDYMNFQEVRSVENIQSLTEKAKFASTDEKVILNFILECDASDPGYTSCIKHTEDRVYWLKGDFLYNVLLAKPVSILRISDIQYHFTDTKVEMEVTFLDLPHLEYIFNSKYISVSEDTFAKMMKTKANNEGECLEKLSRYQETIKVAIFRSSDGVCGYLSDPDDLKEDTKQGQSASVFLFPLNNLHRVKQELTLDQIHDAYLQNRARIYLFDRDYHVRMKIVDVVDKTKKETGLKDDVTSQIRSQAKLKIDDQFTLSVPDVKTFADCYRNCHNSDQVACVTFSFCNTDGKIDCRVSNLQASDITKGDQSIETDQKCQIFSISVLDNYSRKSNRKFITQLSTAVEKDFVYSCAESCHASSECISFQYCDGYCSFGDLLYTDAATEYDQECMIYTRKVSERYQRTGNKIVSDVMLTETKLTLDQCASLCYELSDGDETGCKSFNYCPKSRTESSCSLTHFSVKSPDTKTTGGGHCSNYELKESNGKKRKESSSTKVIKGTTGSGAFGIIMLFLFVGIGLGFIAPFAYSKVKQIHETSKASGGFTWKRHQDEQPLENVD